MSRSGLFSTESDLDTSPPAAAAPSPDLSNTPPLPAFSLSDKEKDNQLSILLRLLQRASRSPEEMIEGALELSLVGLLSRGVLEGLCKSVGLGDAQSASVLGLQSQHALALTQMQRVAAGAPAPAPMAPVSIRTLLEAPIDLHAALTIAEEHIAVEFAGTSAQSSYGINCPLCYTDAYTAFGLRCIIGPEIPNNAGTLDLIRVTAPEGSILNAPFPAAVNARSTMGHMLPDVVYSALDQALPGRVPAEGTSNLWNLKLGAGNGLTGGTQRPFMVTMFHSGGAGARPGQDGLSATPFPSGVKNVPVEVTETIAPIVVWRKDLRDGSGGAGEFRGGDGQIMEVAHRHGEAFGIFATFERVTYPPRGRHGGEEGARGVVRLGSGTALKAKGFQVIPAGDRLVVEMPGGGGMGRAHKPGERSS